MVSIALPEDRATLGSDPSAGRVTEVWRAVPEGYGLSFIFSILWSICSKPRGLGGSAPKYNQIHTF